MRIFSIVLVGMLLFGCKKDAPKSPEAVLLSSPAKNTECAPVQTSSESTNVVQFTWLAADHAETYELRVTNLNTGTIQTKSTQLLTETLPLQRGAPFSWVVVSKNTEVEETATSEQWMFYNPGTQTSYAPFPAEIVSPKLSESVFKDINNEITLEWSGFDLDSDIVDYDIYFSTETPPATLIGTFASGSSSKKVSVLSKTVYYWKVVTKDENGNSSDSGIFSFKVF